MIKNPILRGFCPDPSIIRADNDYYIAVSTFEWWPGVRLFHSVDLKNWEQIPSPLRRYSQLNLIGDPTSGGVWAPCLSYDGNRFYLVYTDVKTKKGRFYNTHNYVVTTNDIMKDWSEPVYLNSIGFDPSLFHDVDGKKYLVNMINGFLGITVQELDADTLALIGEAKLVYSGSGIGCTEGPHMYHIGDWYYLITAEGGTGYDHCVTMARAKNVWGPFETDEESPILTSNQNDRTTLQKCGHADLIETKDNEWYLVHLCSRPIQNRFNVTPAGENEVSNQSWCTLGRETAIQKLVWDDKGWPRLQQGGNYPVSEVEEPKVIQSLQNETVGMQEQTADRYKRLSHGREQPSDAGFMDDFDKNELSVRYSSPRIDYHEFCDCNIRPGYVRIKGLESLNSLHHVALLAVRQQAVCCMAETKMDFTPRYPQQLAGITYFYDALNFYLFGKTINENGKQVLVLLKSDCGVITDEIEPVELKSSREIGLRIQIIGHGASVQFFYQDGTEWKSAGEQYTTEIVSDEHCRGFTGAHFGLYVHDMTGYGIFADFDYMKYSEQANDKE